MKSVLFGLVAVIASALLSGCATQEQQQMPTTQTSVTSSAPMDPYQACLARIPKDATPGQRAVAEQSCARDFAANPGTPGNNQPRAAGAQDDTLEACLSRIPSDASPGQRMIAEQSCQRDEEARRGVRAVPGAR